MKRLPNGVLGLMSRFNRDRHQVLNLHIVMTRTVGRVAQQLGWPARNHAPPAGGIRHHPGADGSQDATGPAAPDPVWRFPVTSELSFRWTVEKNHHAARRSCASSRHSTPLARLDHLRRLRHLSRLARLFRSQLPPTEPQTAAARPVTSGRARFWHGSSTSGCGTETALRAIRSQSATEFRGDWSVRHTTWGDADHERPICGYFRESTRPWMKRPMRQL